jgi:hypothetical protein
VIGTFAATDGMGAITKGYLTLGTAMYFNTHVGQSRTITIEGSRFPWTTGSVTVTARGLHKTVHYGQGYDNRKTIETRFGGTVMTGALQLVTPVLTRWLRPGDDFRTVGIGILRFAPEPHGWMMLVAGASLLGIGYRMRDR